MIAIVHSIYSQSVHAPARDAGLMDNDAERYCTYLIHCIVLFCGTIIKSLHLVKFVSRLTMLIEKYLVFLSEVVLVQCMQLIIFVTLRQCYVRPYMVLCKEWTIALTL